jgi:hypothetical protein
MYNFLRQYIYQNQLGLFTDLYISSLSFMSVALPNGSATVNGGLKSVHLEGL